MAKLLNKELKYVCVFVSGYLVFSKLNTFKGYIILLGGNVRGHVI